MEGGPRHQSARRPQGAWGLQLTRESQASLPNGDPIPCLLVANKCDLPDRPIPKADIQALCDEQGCAARRAPLPASRSRPTPPDRTGTLAG